MVQGAITAIIVQERLRKSFEYQSKMQGYRMNWEASFEYSDCAIQAEVGKNLQDGVGDLMTEVSSSHIQRC